MILVDSNDQVRSEIESAGIELFSFPKTIQEFQAKCSIVSVSGQCENIRLSTGSVTRSARANTAEQLQHRDLPPFVVIGGDISDSGSDPVRSYPWGSACCENIQHCDLPLLR